MQQRGFWQTPEKPTPSPSLYQKHSIFNRFQIFQAIKKDSLIILYTLSSFSALSYNFQ